MSPKWPILCRVERETLTQSISCCSFGLSAQLLCVTGRWERLVSSSFPWRPVTRALAKCLASHIASFTTVASYQRRHWLTLSATMTQVSNRPESGQDWLFPMRQWSISQRRSKIIGSCIVHTKWSMSACCCHGRKAILSWWPISPDIGTLLSLVPRAPSSLHGGMMVVVPVHTRSIGHVVMSRSAQEMLLTHSLVYYSTQLAICPVRNHMCLPVIVLCFFCSALSLLKYTPSPCYACLFLSTVFRFGTFSYRQRAGIIVLTTSGQ